MPRIGIGTGIGIHNGGGFDSSAQAFFSATGITGATQQQAINDLVVGLKADGLWSKMKALYPFVTDKTSQSDIANQFKYNLVNPVDSDAAFRLVFNGGWTFSSNGATPNGTNGYADTKLVPSSVLTQNSTHLSYYSRTNISSSQVEIGSLGTNPDRFNLEVCYNGNLSSDQYNYLTGRVNIANSDSRGFYIGSRTNSTTHKAFKNNSQIGLTNTGLPSSLSLITNPVLIGTANNSSYFSSKQTALASIGDGLTDTEASNFYTRVQAYQTALSRQV